MNETKDKCLIGVLGTQNTGKSTFIGDVRKRYQGTDNEINQVGCDYRKKIEEAGLSINRNGNLLCQQVIMETLLDQICIISNSPSGNYIMDRTPIDAYVYTVYLARHNPELGITSTDLDDMFVRVIASIGSYDKLIYIDLDKCDNVVVVDDKFRDTNIEYRKEIDSIFKEVLNKLGTINPLQFNDILVSDIYGSREERVEKFVKMFENINKER